MRGSRGLTENAAQLAPRPADDDVVRPLQLDRQTGDSFDGARRGNDRVNARTPKPGDQHDIEHMATFMPYVDVFFADQFFASIANQNNLRLGEKFNTTIRALPPGDIPEFIAWLEGLAAESDVATLTERLDASIPEGGFHEDFEARMRE